MVDITSKELWLRVDEWAKKYGPLVRLSVFGQNMIFVNDADVACELFDRRGAIYSGKPRCGCENMIFFTTYNERHKRHRKLMQATLGPRNIAGYHKQLEAGSISLIRSLVSDPSNYNRHFRRYAGGLILSTVYGYTPSSSNDPFLLLGERSMSLLSNEMGAGIGLWPVDVFPILKHIPTWFPGASFKRNAVKWKLKISEFADRPFAFAKERLKRDTSMPSFCSSLLSEENVSPEREADIKWTANSMYTASADPTIAILSNLILAMLLHPQPFEIAKKEMEEVVGTERLPSFEDRDALPYLECLFLEALRWGSPVPLNLPHLVEKEDVYEGMTIPKGSFIIANLWSMLHDEFRYPDPYSFKPERFMNISDPETKRKLDPRTFVFAFGRRRCPGVDLANASLWLTLAAMVATIDVSKARNPDGSVIEPKTEYDDTFFRQDCIALQDYGSSSVEFA
ncbi:hypothetical protein NLJ89_g8281 [Agrocybe chaxingu]|uniref:Cytochrome P450 n=1 Tax=Agrocybe chaxingu TaxID=84603 RepID=A0A9W8JXR3_9AGAR|nr:hypothetical protein NLJ89_g8281 [Agrocybe chaxingu]